VVVELDDMTVGMLVDAVRQVLRIDDALIEPPSPVVTTIDSAFVEGIARTDLGLAIALDLHKVLERDEQVNPAQVNAEGAVESVGKQDNHRG
jgi:purine-binding chemotaxis protein CheW